MSDERQDILSRLPNFKMSRRLFVGAMASTFAVSLLAACGGDDDEEETPEVAAPTATTGGGTTAEPTATTGGGTTAEPTATTGGGTTAEPTATAGDEGALRGVEIREFDNPEAGTPQGDKPDELIMAWGVNQLTTYGMDPQRHSGTVAETWLRHMYEVLVAFERDLQTTFPVLATAWERIDDLTVQFQLREGVTFHNGEPFNAEAVAYSVMRPLQDETAGSVRSVYSGIQEVEVVDDYTVNIRTANPDPALIARMTGFHMTIVAPEWASQSPETPQTDAVGTGPYKFVSWSPNEDMVLEANEEYWGEVPTIKKVRFKVITEQSTRVAALRSGEVHVVKDVPPEEIDSINQTDNVRALRSVSNRVPFYFITVEVEPYDNPLVRQAINYAANVSGVIEAILLGNGNRVSTIMAPWVFGFDPTLEPYPHDPEKAKALLAEAGYPDGIDISIWYIQGRYPKDKEVAEAMAQEMAKANIRCKTELRESTVLTELRQAKECPGLIFASWGNWFFDADNSFSPLFSCAVAEGYDMDWRRPYGCSNPELDEVVAQARVELDIPRRLELYAQAQRMLYDDGGALFMYNLVDMFGVNNWVKWEPRHDEMMWAHEMSWNE